MTLGYALRSNPNSTISASPMLSQACSATPVASQWHTQCPQSSCRFITAPCQPNALPQAARVVGGVSLPEVLHYAPRSPCSSPPIEHTPTSPNHELTPSTLEVISLNDFRLAENLEKAESKVRRVKPKVPFGSSAHIGASTALSARSKSDFSKSLRRASGGLSRRQRGEAPYPLKGCFTAFSHFQLWKFRRKLKICSEISLKMCLIINLLRRSKFCTFLHYFAQGQ